MQMDKHTDGQTHRWTDVQVLKPTYGPTYRCSSTQMDRHADGKIQMDRQTDKQTHRWSNHEWTDTQRNKHKLTSIQITHQTDAPKTLTPSKKLQPSPQRNGISIEKGMT